jgi:glycine/D-amino acid oxidase-like deaminating enzyme
MIDTLVIGGGFFGLCIAEHLAQRGRQTLVCEVGHELMARASYNNQARVHNGYHYPRSLLTAHRSHVNYPRFVDEFADCVDRSFTSIYAISRVLSKVTATQFCHYMRRVGSPIERATNEIRKQFDFRFVDDVFLTEECVFDADKLRERMFSRASRAGVQIRCRTRVDKLSPYKGGGILATLITEGEEPELVFARMVVNCAYSGINVVLRASGLELIPLKYELTELCLVRMPEPLNHLGITVMCGPFFSCIPFPPRGLHTLSHVRYTPHCHWFDDEVSYEEPYARLVRTRLQTAFPYMVRDARRYMPPLTACDYVDSLWEVKTVLPRSEIDDGRPILFKSHHGIENHHVVMGGKIDNVYDAVQEIDQLLGNEV